ncbi:MAG: hypothetical protein ABR575_07540 [Actinomycetota bacterium]
MSDRTENRRKTIALLALALVVGASLTFGVVREGPSLPALLGVGGLVVAAALAWPQSSRARAAADAAFYAFFGLYSVGAVIWLVMGLAPAVAAAPGLHDALHTWAAQGGRFGSLAGNIASASHGAERPLLVAFGYLFSGLNLGLAWFLMRRRPGDRTARLLALGMVGTAATFNLQAHASLVVVPALKGVTHDVFHVLTGVAYVLALLLFPTGEFVPRWSQLAWWRWPLRIAYLLALTVAGLTIASNFHGDNAVGWVAFFGFLIPIAGVTSQVSRYRHAASREQRQQSRILMWALTIAFAAALVMVGAMVGFTSGSDSQTTKSYEFKSPQAGVYFFRCDPHADEMRGTFEVVTGERAPTRVELAAEDNRFDTSVVQVQAGRDVVVRFTNKDGEGHNLSVYRSPTGRDPVFVGQVFSGQDLSGFVFFVFPLLFAAIPITLFVVLVRYRLWEIDQVINRALVYAVLSGILGAIYLGIVILLGNILRGITGTDGRENNLVIAVSTLAVAALFTPVRKQIQGFIDFRFYRRKYDAGKTLESFAAKLKDHVDLDALTGDLLKVVEDTMQPARVSLWLRDTGGGDADPGAATPAPVEHHLVRNDAR